jgi:hypothetical protein
MKNVFLRHWQFSAFFQNTQAYYGLAQIIMQKKFYNICLSSGKHVPRAIFVDLEPTVIGKRKTLSLLILMLVRGRHAILSTDIYTTDILSTVI